jgi:hypothetical protein
MLLCATNKKMNALVKSSRSVFWNDLYHVANKNQLVFANNYSENNYSEKYYYEQDETYYKYLPFFVPRHLYRQGITNNFRYGKKIYGLLCKNRDAFLRVITMFTIFLSGTINECSLEQVFVAEYNAKTQTVLQCNLLWLLVCAYHEAPCRGRFYIFRNGIASKHILADQPPPGFLDEFLDEQDKKAIDNEDDPDNDPDDEPDNDPDDEPDDEPDDDPDDEPDDDPDNEPDDDPDNDEPDNDENEADDAGDSVDNGTNQDSMEEEVMKEIKRNIETLAFKRKIAKPYDTDEEDDSVDDNTSPYSMEEEVMEETKRDVGAKASGHKKEPFIGIGGLVSKDQYTEGLDTQDWDHVNEPEQFVAEHKQDPAPIPGNDEHGAMKLNSPEFMDAFARYIDLDKKDEHRNGYQVYDCVDDFKLSIYCDWGDMCWACWPPTITHKTLRHNIIKNNLIFDFSSQKIDITECKNHQSNDMVKCYLANISKLKMKPYFHASCQETLIDYDLVKNKSMSFYKNKYIDSIHIKITKTHDATQFIETTYSCIDSF